MPIEPPPSRWAFPPATEADAHGVVGLGADLAPGTILEAYRSGLFPMPVGRGGSIAWWSPDPRGVIPLESFHVSRSLRRSWRRFEVSADADVGAVIDACADPVRDGGWITQEIRDAYLRLHELGWVHSVETWSSDGRLVGGVYGVSINGFFAGESMFHRESNASKVALAALVDRLAKAGATLLDVQWTTPHLRSLGAIDVDRSRYLQLLAHALATPAQPFAAVA